MDGTVQVSVLQWEQQRAELVALKEKVAELEDKKKEVKVILTSQENGGHFKYNRWTQQNEWISEGKEVSSVIWTNFDKVKPMLEDEAKSKVEDDIEKVMVENSELQQESRLNAVKTKEKVRKVTEDFEKLLTETRDGYEKRITELENDLSEKRIKDRETSLKEEIDRLKNLVTNKNEKIDFIFSMLPRWKRNKITK